MLNLFQHLTRKVNLFSEFQSASRGLRDLFKFVIASDSVAIFTLTVNNIKGTRLLRTSQ